MPVSEKIGQWTDDFVSGLFTPYRLPDRVFGNVGKWLVGITLVLAVVLDLPPLRNVIACHTNIASVSSEAREQIKNWCDWVASTFQILIFVTVGGIAFTEQTASYVTKTIRDLVNTQQGNMTAEQIALRTELEECLKALRELPTGATIWNMVPRLYAAFRISRRVYRIATHDLPRHMAVFLTIRLVTNWQGNTAGFAAFGLFVPWAVAPILKTYFDYAPVCH